MADTFGEWNYQVENGAASIIGYTGSGGAVTIPSEVNGIPVKQVGYGTSIGYENTNVTSVTIPNSVTNIAEYAFSGWTSLTNIAFNHPSSLASIGDWAFINSGLSSVTIPNGVTNIGLGVFQGCTNLKSVAIPNSVTRISAGVFGYCPSLTNVSLPPHFMADASHIGITGALAADNLVLSLANTLATNTTFINNLAQAIISASNNYGLATQSAIATATSNLATQSQITTAINEGKASGIASVTASPNTWSLFTTSQIQNMAIGDLVLTRTNNGSFVLNYDIEQSEDLQNWTPYQGFAMPLTNLPTNKAFVRIKAKQ